MKRRFMQNIGPVLLALASITGSMSAQTIARKPARTISLHAARQLSSDLEITSFSANSIHYLSWADLNHLPSITVTLPHDPNFSNQTVRITGVPLETLAAALNIPASSDLIDALCTDRYRSHFPQTYIAAHHPILGLKINGKAPSVWAAETHNEDPGPYFITYAHFVPAFRVLSHSDEAQLPTNVIRLNFSSTALTFGAITPIGSFAPDSPPLQGFTIAKQNCLRCHFSGPYGGTKSGHDWLSLSTWAREQPAFFARYVHNPRAVESHAHMPAFPDYDAATLAALTAYFRTFTSQP
jgi:mono/diheme cytochrome c family protein